MVRKRSDDESTEAPETPSTEGTVEASAARGSSPSLLASIVAIVAIATVVVGVSAVFLKPALDSEVADTAASGSADTTSAEPASPTPPATAQTAVAAADISQPTAVPASAGADMDSYAHAVIHVETTAYDMGIIASDTIAKQIMKISNEGSVPLRISQVKTSCGCTMGNMLDKTIAPGGEGRLEISVDPSRIPGFSSNKTLTIFSNDPNNPTVRVKVAAVVDPEVDLIPKEIEFGTVEQGQIAEKSITIRQLQEADFQITTIETPGSKGALEVTLDEVPEAEWSISGHREYLVTAKVLASAPSGPVNTRVLLGTNLDRVKRLTFPLSVDIRGIYDIKPRTVYLRSVTPGESFKGVLKISSGEAIELAGFEAKDGNPHISVTNRRGDEPNTILFDVTITENPSARLLRDTWQLRILARGEEHVEEIRVLAVIDPKTLDGGAAKASTEQRDAISK